MASSRAIHRLEVLVDLQLDGRLSATARLILGSLPPLAGGGVVSPTDRELAELHGCSERTVRSALAAGVRAGWIRRLTRAEAMAERLVPREAAKGRRYLVLLWVVEAREPATFCRQLPAASPLATGRKLPAPTELPAESCRPLACAPVSNPSLRTKREERTSDFSPPVGMPPLTGCSPATKRLFAAQFERTRAEESQPGYTPPPPPWWETRRPPTPAPTRRMKVEELVAACLGPESAAALESLVLWLMVELGDRDNAITRSAWLRSIPRLLESAEGFGQLVELILAAPKKPKPANWLSTCLARGRPDASQQKNRPPEPHTTVPRGSAEETNDAGDPSGYKYTRRVNP